MWAGQHVAYAVVCAGVEVARGARRASVAAGLHVPEQRLAECDEGLRIAHVPTKVLRPGDRHAAERRDRQSGATAGAATRLRSEQRLQQDDAEEAEGERQRRV